MHEELFPNLIPFRSEVGVEAGWELVLLGRACAGQAEMKEKYMR